MDPLARHPLAPGALSRRDALRRMGGALAWAGASGMGALASAGAGRPPSAGPGPVAPLASVTDPAAPAISPLGAQLYTVRGELARDLAGTLARVAAIGYREVEFAGYFGRSAAQVRNALEGAGLASPSAHVPAETLGERWPAALDEAGRVGHRWLVVPSLPSAMRSTLAQVRATAERFNRAGEEARLAGLRFAFHNHDEELVPVEGRVPLEVLFEETDPALVDFQLDVFWVVEGGGDPLAFLDRWPERVPFLHLKDRTRDGRMVDVGAGAIDWPAVLSRPYPGGARHLYVEHDEPPEPFTSLRASWVYLSGLEV